ncbi:hypothetical protein BC830DRAFT_1165501 [Chytriomyces sp. MP71]|nr:hypothetical protein BC830DRAFT_1165501 [Chytriomyces sp. MP71]
MSLAAQAISLIVGVAGGFAILVCAKHLTGRAQKAVQVPVKTNSVHHEASEIETNRNPLLIIGLDQGLSDDSDAPITRQEKVHRTVQSLAAHIQEYEASKAPKLEPRFLSPLSISSSSHPRSPWSRARLGIVIPENRSSTISASSNSPTSASSFPRLQLQHTSTQTHSPRSTTSTVSATTHFSHLERKSAVSEPHSNSHKSSPTASTVVAHQEDCINGLNDTLNLPYGINEVVAEFGRVEEESAKLQECDFLNDAEVTAQHMWDTKQLVNLLFSYTMEEEERDAVIHRSIQCNHCQNQIRGIRYNCFNCVDYSLCATCENLGDVHIKTHVFVKIKTPLPPSKEMNGFGVPQFYPGINLSGWSLEVEASKVNRGCHFEEEEIKGLFQQFLSLATVQPSKDLPGGITRETFDLCIGALAKEKNLINDRIFAFFDRDGDGVVAFPEFVSGLGIMTKGTPEEHVFKGYDLNGDGVLSRLELRKMFKAYYDLSMQLVSQYVRDLGSPLSGQFPVRASIGYRAFQESRRRSKASLTTIGSSPIVEIGDTVNLSPTGSGGNLKAGEKDAESCFNEMVDLPAIEMMSQDAVDEMVEAMFVAAQAHDASSITFEEFERAVVQDNSFVLWFDSLGSVF